MKENKTAVAIFLFSFGLALIIGGHYFHTKPPLARTSGSIVIISSLILYFGDRKIENEQKI